MSAKFYRRTVSCLLAAAIALGSCLPVFAASPQESVALACRSAILMEASTGEVLFAHNADSHAAPASITKVMTMLLVMEALEDGNLTLEEKVTASPYACSMGGSQIWLEPMEQMTVDELLRATAIGSANDAAVALAEHLGGSEAAFVEQMNRRAAELGLENTHFVNACGLDEEGHYTSARDIALLCRELLRHEEITAYTSTWMDSLRNGETELVNTNRLVRFYEGCTGLKTGTTDQAGSCLAASAKRGELELIAVVLGAKNSSDRFDSTRALLDYGFANYTAEPTPDISPQLTPVRVRHGSLDRVEVTALPPEKIILEKQAKTSLEQQVELVPEVEAPVETGDKLGTVTVYVDGAPKTTYDVVAAQRVERMTPWLAFHKLLERAVGTPAA